MSDSSTYRRQALHQAPRPWDSTRTLGGCHFSPRMKVKSESLSCCHGSDSHGPHGLGSLPGTLHPWDFPAGRHSDFPEPPGKPSVVKNLPPVQERFRRHWFDPWSRKDLLEEEIVIHSSILSEQRSLAGYSLWGCKESGT